MEKRMARLACAVAAFAVTAAAQLSPAGEGRRLYLANNCYGCHGGRAGGGNFGFRAPEFRDEKPDLGDLTEVLRGGGESGMPAFPKLTTTDINNLYAYFQSLRTSAEPTFNDWWQAVPTAMNGIFDLPWPNWFLPNQLNQQNRATILLTKATRNTSGYGASRMYYIEPQK